MNTRNLSNVKIQVYKCCRCQEVNRGVIATRCRCCSHAACIRCGFPDSSEQNQTAKAQDSQSSQPVPGSSEASRTPTESMYDYFGRDTLSEKDSRSAVSLGAGQSSLSLYPLSSDVLENPMGPPATPGGYLGELALRSFGGNVPGIPGPYQVVKSAHGSLPTSPHHQFSPARRAARRPDPLQISNVAQYPGPSSAMGEMQTPPSSSTSAYFSDSAMSGSLPLSDNDYLQWDISGASLTGEESLTADEPIPAIPILPPPRLSRPGGPVPRRPAILSEKSPKRPMLRKPKGPLPPRVVKPGDPKDYKTAQNTIAARGTRQRKNDSQSWLLRYRDETKDYILDLEHVLTERNERVALLQRENNNLRAMLTDHPGSNPRPSTIDLSPYNAHSTLSHSGPPSFDDYTTAGTGNAALLERVGAGTAPMLSRGYSAPDLSRDSPYLSSPSTNQQGLDDSEIAGHKTANPWEQSFEQLRSGGPSVNELSRANSLPDPPTSHLGSLNENSIHDPNTGNRLEQNALEGAPDGQHIPLEMDGILLNDDFVFGDDPSTGQGYDWSY